MKVIVTAGPTREPVDDVRYLSNVSSGRLGAALAGAFLDAGHSVVFLRGPGAAAPPEHRRLTELGFTTAASLLARLLERLRDERPDALVHAAAVADYAPAPIRGKIPSGRERWTLPLEPTPKVVDAVREAAPDLPILTFKLESGVTREELHARARASRDRVGAFAVFANRLEDVQESGHAGDLLPRDGTCVPLSGRQAVARGIVLATERALAAAGRTHGAGA